MEESIIAAFDKLSRNSSHFEFQGFIRFLHSGLEKFDREELCSLEMIIFNQIINGTSWRDAYLLCVADLISCEIRKRSVNSDKEEIESMLSDERYVSVLKHINSSDRNRATNSSIDKAFNYENIRTIFSNLIFYEFIERVIFDNNERGYGLTIKGRNLF